MSSESGTGSTAPLSPSLLLDEDTRTLIEQVHHAWSSNAPISTFANIRDKVLASRSRVEVEILTLSSVVEIACPQHITDDSSWSAFFTLASTCAVDIGDDPYLTLGSRVHKKQKRTDNAARRRRNVALVAALWSLPLIDYYGWSSAGNAQINLIRACAQRWPRFVDDFCPRLNSVLLQRHCEALRNSRVRWLNEVSLQPLRDFNIAALEKAVVDQAWLHQWTLDDDGSITIDNDGGVLNQVKPNHFRLYLLKQDRYGLVVSRSALSAPRSPRIEANLTPSSPLSFTAGLTASVNPSGDDVAFNLDIVDISSNSPFPHPDTATLVGAELTSNGSSSRVHASTPELGQSTALSTCAIVSDQYEALGAGQERSIWQIYRPSPPQLTLDPAVLSLHRENVHETQPQDEHRVLPEHPVQERSSSSAGEPRSTSHCSSLQSPQHLAQSRPVLSPSLTVVTNQQTVLTVCSPIVHREGPLSFEEVMHNRHRGTILAYVKMISIEANHADVSVQRKLRAKWLTDRTAWASFFTRDSPKHTTGGARSYEEADVLYMTSDEFIAAASQNQVFDKLILIKESFSDSGMHTVGGLASQLIDTSPNATVDVKSLDHEQSEQMLIQDFVNCARPDRPRAGSGAIAMNLRNVTKAHRPLFTMLSRFRLLESLINRAQGENLGKLTRPSLTNVSDGTSFNVLGTSGAFSGPQLHPLSGVWFRNLDSAKLLIIVPESAMGTAEWDAFSKVGSGWFPRSGSKLLVLERDDVFLIPPGLKIVYAFHCLRNNAMEGAIFWDDLNVVAMVQAILWTRKHQMATDDVLAHHLPRIIDNLCLLVRSQVDRFLGSLERGDVLEFFDRMVSELKGLDQASNCRLVT